MYFTSLCTGNSAQRFGLSKQGQSMSERGKDKGKQPGKKTVPTRSSSRILAVGPVNYKEVELTTSEEDSEGTLEGVNWDLVV